MKKGTYVKVVKIGSLSGRPASIEKGRVFEGKLRMDAKKGSHIVIGNLMSPTDIVTTEILSVKGDLYTTKNSVYRVTRCSSPS